jgi:hypothetical protein
VLSRTRIASWILLSAGFLLVGIGLVINAMWTQVPWEPAAILAGLGFAALILAYGLARLFHCQPATAAAAVWLVALIYFAGISPFASVLLIAVSAMALGSIFVPEDLAARVPLSVLAGVALLCGIDGWLLPFPIHGHTAYALVLLTLGIARWPAVLSMARPLTRSWTAAVASAPHAALLAVFAMGVISTCAWVPTIHYDDLAYHLGLPYQLDMLGYYRMDAGSQLWALSAWAGDVVQGVAQVVAGSEARGAVDVLWLILTATMMWGLCEALGLSPRMRWLAVAIYASLPMTAGTLTSMHTEGATAAVAVGVALLIQRTAVPSRRQLLLVALLFGLLLGLKVSNLMIAGPLGLWLLWQWRAKLPWRALPLAVVLALFVAGSSYFYAYLLTGNPVLPVFNAFFHSPYFGFWNFHDTTWDAGFRWRIPWDLTFHTSKYVESWDGAGGFILLALLGSLLMAMTHRRARPLALIASVAFLLPLTQIQYLRYAYPAMALLVPAMLCGIPVDDQGRSRVNAAALMLVVLVLGNLAFVANGDWQLRQGVLLDVLTGGRVATTDTYAPTRRLAEFIRDRYGSQARTLMLDSKRPFAAELAGNAFVTNWYDQELSTLVPGAKNDSSVAAWSGLFDRTGANLLMVNKVEHTQALDAAIEEVQGTRVYEFGDLELWELHPGTVGVEVPAPAHVVVVKFDTSSTPSHATVVSADLKLQCKAMDIPIVISWDIAQVDGQHWRRSEWARCLQTGNAEVSMDASLPLKVTGFTVSAFPSKPVDLKLQLGMAKAAFRRDLAADRDLSRLWRGDVIGQLKIWNKARLAARRARG